MRLGELLDLSVLERLAEANHRATGMSVGIVDAVDGASVVRSGCQELCEMHRAHPECAARCRECDAYLNGHVSEVARCEHECGNGLREIGIPIRVAGAHLATLLLGQFLYEGESPGRDAFARRASAFGFDAGEYLAALDRVPVLSRAAVESILAQNTALSRAISDLAEAAFRRRQAEDALERERNILSSVVQATDVMLVYLDPAFDFVWVNVAYAATCNVRPDELVGKNHFALYPHAENEAIFRRVRDTGEPVFYRDQPFEFPDQPQRGVTHWDWSLVPVKDGGGAVQGLVFSLRETTKLKRAELQLDAERMRWRGVVEGIADEVWGCDANGKAADRRKDEFIGMLSHELRNPLAPIRNSIYILRHADPGGEQARRAQAVIERQTEHLTRLLDDLLDVTRMTRAKIELRCARVDLRGVVARAADDFRLLLHDRGIEYHVEIADVSLWADADATRITQLVGNLLHNAAKFTRRGDRVALSLRRSGAGDAEIRVKDTGAGIPATLVPKVFDPFVQGERTLARSEGGLGLGLALVKGIAELHGGTARVASAGVGLGAEFVVSLPLVPAPGGEAAERPAVAGPSAGRRVLVVDDNADAAETLAEIAAFLGHVVEVAHDGPSAIEKAHELSPDVVLCDIGLPGMSGYDVARALRATGRTGMQLIAVSGYVQPEDVRRAIDAGFDAHVAKPADVSEIERLLSR